MVSKRTQSSPTVKHGYERVYISISMILFLMISIVSYRYLHYSRYYALQVVYGGDNADGETAQLYWGEFFWNFDDSRMNEQEIAENEVIFSLKESIETDSKYYRIDPANSAVGKFSIREIKLMRGKSVISVYGSDMILEGIEQLHDLTVEQRNGELVFEAFGADPYIVFDKNIGIWVAEKYSGNYAKTQKVLFCVNFFCNNSTLLSDFFCDFVSGSFM